MCARIERYAAFGNPYMDLTPPLDLAVDSKRSHPLACIRVTAHIHSDLFDHQIQSIQVFGGKLSAARALPDKLLNLCQRAELGRKGRREHGR